MLVFNFLLMIKVLWWTLWFDGKVFNKEESLKSTKLDELELKSLKYIFISHEHPDHLNFDTLKKYIQLTIILHVSFHLEKTKL